MVLSPIELFARVLDVFSKRLGLLFRYYIVKRSFPATPADTCSTLRRIVDNKASICRFGDGEFDIMLMLDDAKDAYQAGSLELSRRLAEILAEESRDDLVIAIPPISPKTFHLDKKIKGLPFWKWYYARRIDLIKPFLSASGYYNSMVSRYPVFFENDIDDIKGIWAGRDVVFVYGKGSRFIMDERLFDNIAGYCVEHCLPTNAFAEYDDLYGRLCTYPRERLILISAGPTATVLAYDLYKAGFQAIDLGHLPASYQQYLGELSSPESLPMRQ